MTRPASNNHTKREALLRAFPYTLPIMAGFLFLGITYGIYMRSLGHPAAYPVLMSVTVFAGSMEFVAGELLLGAFRPVHIFLITLMVNARHIFYGISMLERYRGAGKKRFYLIFGMCDESFSINCTARVPDGIDRGWFWFFVTLLNQLYWITGATLGSLFGSLIRVSTEGLDFVMTALFVVIFTDNWIREKDHTSSLLGLAIPAAALILLGADRFMIPSMAAIIVVLLARYGKEERSAET